MKILSFTIAAESIIEVDEKGDARCHRLCPHFTLSIWRENFQCALHHGWRIETAKFKVSPEKIEEMQMPLIVGCCLMKYQETKNESKM